MTSSASHKNQTIFQPRRSLSNSGLFFMLSIPKDQTQCGFIDSPHAFKRENHDENVHLDPTKKPKRTGKYHRKNEQRVASSLGIPNSLMPFSAGTGQPQPFQGFLTHRPSMTGFDSLSSVSHLSFIPTPNHALFVTGNEPEQVDTISDNGDMAFTPALTLGPSPLSSLSNSRTQPVIQNHSIPGFRRYSLPMTTQLPPTPPSRPVIHTNSRPPSPALQLPPIPEMPSPEVDTSIRQQLLDNTIKIHKRLLEEWQQETHQHTKAILLNNIVERNKFVFIF